MVGLGSHPGQSSCWKAGSRCFWPNALSRYRVLPLVLLVTAIFVVCAYQFDRIYTVDAGRYADRPFLRGFHDREGVDGLEPFRWTGARSEVIFPGVGARDRWLLVRLGGHEYAGLADRTVRIAVNGTVMSEVVVSKGWQAYRFWIPASEQHLGSVRVTLETTPFVPAEVAGGEDDRLVGVKVSRVELVPMSNGFSAGWPALVPLLWCLLLVAGIYAGLSTWVVSWRGAAVVALLVAAAVACALSVYRLQVAAYLPRLVAGMLLGLALAAASGRLARLLYRWSGVAASDRDVRWLQAIFLVGFWLKAWGLLYPNSVAIDLKWHLWQAQRIVDGELATIYKPGALAFWIAPDQWGGSLEAAVPYSPFYHITAAAFFFLPWPPYVTANLLSVFLDTSRGFLLYGLARKLGMGNRAGIFAALLYGLFPTTFLLHSWGNVPTTTGLWWAIAATWYLVAGWEKMKRWTVWSGLVVLLLGTMLYYSVIAAFIVVFFVLLLLGLSWSRSLEVRPLGRVGLALVVAVGLAMAIYYWQYVPPLLLLLRSGRLGAGLGSTAQSVPVTVFLWRTLVRIASLRYGLLWPAVLAFVGLWAGRGCLRNPLTRWLTWSWFLTGLLFLAVDYRIQLVDKHIFFLMPLLALWGGVALDWLLGSRCWGKAIVWATALALAVASLHTWLYRLSNVQQEWTEADIRIVGERLAPLMVAGIQRLLGL